MSLYSLSKYISPELAGDGEADLGLTLCLGRLSELFSLSGHQLPRGTQSDDGICCVNSSQHKSTLFKWKVAPYYHSVENYNKGS